MLKRTTGPLLSTEAGSRLVAKGYGLDRPVREIGTPEERRENRRVAFIMEPSGAAPKRRALVEGAAPLDEASSRVARGTAFDFQEDESRVVQLAAIRWSVRTHDRAWEEGGTLRFPCSMRQ
ncbi:hypothetical protein D187_010293 [Cystobacter fuscus DSM 2262]|uniref:OmpA-like domain-containing protein n=1 Tax=Cystobacter fuscus (strain ATCC 25194 / DSM 2262 / NBRC 100088 / M29) TaxID=1242864 RepID=S9QK91_CYSF2|nr:hypothetical protein D187_010293 [Cystobacter fuscus DSM 2262]